MANIFTQRTPSAVSTSFLWTMKNPFFALSKHFRNTQLPFILTASQCIEISQQIPWFMWAGRNKRAGHKRGPVPNVAIPVTSTSFHRQKKRKQLSTVIFPSKYIQQWKKNPICSDVCWFFFFGLLIWKIHNKFIGMEGDNKTDWNSQYLLFVFDIENFRQNARLHFPSICCRVVSLLLLLLANLLPIMFGIAKWNE